MVAGQSGPTPPHLPARRFAYGSSFTRQKLRGRWSAKSSVNAADPTTFVTESISILVEESVVTWTRYEPGGPARVSVNLPATVGCPTGRMCFGIHSSHTSLRLSALDYWPTRAWITTQTVPDNNKSQKMPIDIQTIIGVL